MLSDHVRSNGALMNIQHVNVKIFAGPGNPADLSAALVIFHRWIREETAEELLIDVADYRHVPAGPGVILVGHEANYSLDNRENRLGLLYNRKTVADADPPQQIAGAIRSALWACRKLEQEPEFAGALTFDDNYIEIVINDRLLAPNTDETFEELRQAVHQALEWVAAPRTFYLQRAGEPRERLRLTAKAA